MGLKILWSKQAEKGYDNIVKHLEKEWTDREVNKFIRETNHFFELLMQNPHILEQSQNHSNLYRGPINRLTILTYRYKPRKEEIILVNIRSTRKKPLK
jgi:plasmid stabilization system protein ParE